MASRPLICGHCGLTMRGHAFVNDDALCHPDDGMDCYHLVTVYKHPMACPTCQSARPVHNVVPPVSSDVVPF